MLKFYFSRNNDNQGQVKRAINNLPPPLGIPYILSPISV